MDVDEAEGEGVVVATWEEDGEDTWEDVVEEGDAGEAEGGINMGIGMVVAVEITTTITETSRGVDQHLGRIIGGRKQLRH